MKNFEIESTGDVYNFLNFIFLKCLCSFDPAEHLSMLKTASGDPVFASDEILCYEKTMNAAFIFCVFNKINIYGFSEFVKEQDPIKHAA